MERYTVSRNRRAVTDVDERRPESASRLDHGRDSLAPVGTLRPQFSHETTQRHVGHVKIYRLRFRKVTRADSLTPESWNPGGGFWRSSVRARDGGALTGLQAQLLQLDEARRLQQGLEAAHVGRRAAQFERARCHAATGHARRAPLTWPSSRRPMASRRRRHVAVVADQSRGSRRPAEVERSMPLQRSNALAAGGRRGAIVYLATLYARAFHLAVNVFVFAIGRPATNCSSLFRIVELLNRGQDAVNISSGTCCVYIITIPKLLANRSALGMFIE
ncbi:unnamed protein product [Pieris macdunnoughi]|uniref:Uncharacterized protein n=1 Tax=Pieris macdunnoughi TaxID=345717 RepID=A0A821UA15_9NEOP|nr:unnamed protein product [Pieris macdunnoughi]